MRKRVLWVVLSVVLGVSVWNLALWKGWFGVFPGRAPMVSVFGHGLNVISPRLEARLEGATFDGYYEDRRLGLNVISRHADLSGFPHIAADCGRACQERPLPALHARVEVKNFLVGTKDIFVDIAPFADIDRETGRMEIGEAPLDCLLEVLVVEAGSLGGSGGVLLPCHLALVEAAGRDARVKAQVSYTAGF